MELIKNNLRMNRIIKSDTVTFYVNREERLVEGNPDIANVIRQKEIATVDYVTVRNNQLIINGTISYNMLYYTSEDGTSNGVEGEMSFEENVKMQGLKEEDKADIRLVVTNSSVKLLDGRSYIYKVQMMAYIIIETMEELEVVSEAENQNMMVKKGELEALSVVVDKTDTFRIGEQISLPSGKPSISKIIWKDIRIKNINTKVMDGMIHIGGELYVFILYTPEETEKGGQWIETTLGFGGNLELEEAREDMISYIGVDMHDINVEAQMNQDNEVRMLDIGAVLKLSIKLYEEKKIEVIEDVYMPGKMLVPSTEKKNYEKLLVKNASRTKITVPIDVDENKGHILQILSSSAQVKVENIIVSDNGLKVLGKLKTCVMYISSEDSTPICSQSEETDFEHRIDAEGISADDKYYMNWRVEQVSANMISTEKIEIKAVIALEAIVFKEDQMAFITQIEEQPMDMEAFNAAPVLKGYVVQQGDTLWTLAKNNYTTIESIMQINNLTSEQIKRGDRLLLLKSCQ